MFTVIRRRSRVFVALVLLFSPALAAIPFPQSNSDLKADARVRFGTLPNGLRYVIRPNHEPKNRASLRLMVEAGSLEERDTQRGLAHFLEHMAFNGSTHYAPGTLVEFFQRMGMNFGGDTNANTGFERTLYLLELPNTKDETLAEGLQVFGDYAGGLLLKPELIDKERGIILSEKRTRDDVGYRTFVAQFSFLLNGSLPPTRLPIGETDIIQHAQRDQFVDLYNTWYRPELMSVVVVGDVNPDTVEKQITAALGPVKDRAPARPMPDYGSFKTTDGVRVFHHAEPEAPDTNVSIATIVPWRHPTDTAERRRRELPRSLANAMINRRLSILAKQENAPFTEGHADVEEAMNYYRHTEISLSCRADQWQGALGVADRELRRALEFGFQPAELHEVVANFRNSLEQAVKTDPTRRSDGIADEITESLLERDVYTSAADDLALYGPALEKITVADCLAGLREVWPGNQRLVMVTGNANIGAATAAAGGNSARADTAAALQPDQQEILRVYEKSHVQPVQAGAAIADVKWGYDNFGDAGKVAKREHVDDAIDATLLTFANGVRLNLKRTDFEANRIRISVRLGNGQLTEPAGKPGLAAYTNETYTEGGLGKHSVDDLRRILAGRTVGASFRAGGDAFILGGQTNREDLLLELQLLTATIVDPGFRPEAARQARKALEELYLDFAHTASGPFTLQVARLLASGDHRFGLPSKEEMLKRNLDEVRAWTAHDREHGAIEIAIVGDIDIDATIDAVARTFGTLPAREAKPALDELHAVKFPAEPFARTYPIDSEIPKGTVALYWPTTDALEIHRTRRLTMLGEILSDRLRVEVREKLGDAYSPGAGNNPSDIYPGYGYMVAEVTVDPSRAKEVADTVVKVANDLAERGVTDDELQRAKQPILTALRESARTNQYWLGSVLARAQERPQMLDWCRSRYADNESITKADLDALAKTYLGASHASRVIIVPAAVTAKAAGAGTAPGVK